MRAVRPSVSRRSSNTTVRHYPSRAWAVTTLLCCVLLAGCEPSSKPTSVASLGTTRSSDAMLEALRGEGELVVQKHLMARWQVPLSGLVNLDHPRAAAAGLEDRDEPIQLFTYTITHPEHGTFLVDSGVSERFRNPATNNVSALVNAVMRFDTLQLEKTMKDVAEEVAPISGVFLTHIHMDHILGLTDLEGDTPVYVGPGETRLKHFMHAFTRGTTDRLLERQAALEELPFSESRILDVFGDGSFFAFHAPGHTPGTTVYIANATEGVHIMLGDVSHTRWGWENQVEPGSFSYNQAESAISMAAVRQLVDALDNVTVHPGHQP